jgi:RNA polymerase sigma-70 factor (ECF subfamily)
MLREIPLVEEDGASEIGRNERQDHDQDAELDQGTPLVETRGKRGELDAEHDLHQADERNGEWHAKRDRNPDMSRQNPQAPEGEVEDQGDQGPSQTLDGVAEPRVSQPWFEARAPRFGQRPQQEPEAAVLEFAQPFEQRGLARTLVVGSARWANPGREVDPHRRNRPTTCRSAWRRMRRPTLAADGPCCHALRAGRWQLHKSCLSQLDDLGVRCMSSPHTSHSLLERARDSADAASWRKLIDLYTPLIRRSVRPSVAQPADADDVVQDVLAALARELPRFAHSGRPGAFRAWLRALTVNRLREHWRTRRPAVGGDEILDRLNQLEDPASALSRAWDEEHDRHVTATLLDAIRLEFQPATWRAFEATVRDGRPTEQVAAELGTTVNAVLICKSRVLKRLRQKAGGLID